MNAVVHFDLPMQDAKRATTFYQTVFGWEISDWPGMEHPYAMALTTEVDQTTKRPVHPGAINGGLNGDPAVTTPIIVLATDDIDASIATVIVHGGSIVREKVNVGGMGWYAFIKDTEGNVIGLWQDISQG